MDYYIYDLERKMFWKANKYGYTLKLEEALKVTSKKEAQKYVNDDLDKNTLALTMNVIQNLILEK